MIRSYLMLISRVFLAIVLVVSFSIAPVLDAIAATPAKKLFGAKRLPVVMKPAAVGFYSKGCLAGGVAIPEYGPHWQVMRPSRNRRWGLPVLVNMLEKLSVDAIKTGWSGLMVGDMSQPRGGPMLSGHASHQVGLDVDIWLRPMTRKWTRREREKLSAYSVLRRGTVRLNDKIWNKSYTGLIRTAAKYSEVQRIFVHPAIKKRLCNTITGDRSWLNKVRPYWGHYDHIHIRLFCPPGSTNCRRQKSTGSGTGCDKSLDWWFKVAFAPKKKTKKKKLVKRKKKKKKKKKIRRYKIMADLPSQCRVVLNGPNPLSLASVIYKSGNKRGKTVIAAKTISPANISAIAASTTESPAARAVNALANTTPNKSEYTIPTPRPIR